MGEGEGEWVWCGAHVPCDFVSLVLALGCGRLAQAALALRALLAALALRALLAALTLRALLAALMLTLG